VVECNRLKADRGAFAKPMQGGNVDDGDGQEQLLGSGQDLSDDHEQQQSVAAIDYYIRA
jgi:hypothetical protein